MSGECVLIDHPAEGVARITLNRPDRLNAMNAELVSRLTGVLGAISSDSSCRVVILTGAGRGFCAGLDLKGFAPGGGGTTDNSIQATFSVQKSIVGIVNAMRDLPQPVIAAVNGPATGGGLALVLASDIRIGATSARFNAAFVRIGLSACDVGTSWLLPRLVGASRAHELMLTGRLFEADEAERIGLLVDVVDDDRLQGRTLEEAALVLANSPMGIRMTKEVMWSALETPAMRSAIDLENRTQVMLSRTFDHREALSAFLEKREPSFEDR